MHSLYSLSILESKVKRRRSCDRRQVDGIVTWLHGWSDSLRPVPLQALCSLGLLLALAHDGQQPYEDVGEVEEDVDRHIDGVVHRLVETAGHVQVVDHDQAEQHQHGPVQDAEDELNVHAHGGQDDVAELNDDRPDQQTE